MLVNFPARKHKALKFPFASYHFRSLTGRNFEFFFFSLNRTWISLNWTWTSLNRTWIEIELKLNFGQYDIATIGLPYVGWRLIFLFKNALQSLRVCLHWRLFIIFNRHDFLKKLCLCTCNYVYILAIIFKTFLPQGRALVWKWVQITNIDV